SRSGGLVGAAVATVMVEVSTLIGQAVYWRRYFWERFLITGGVLGKSSAARKGRLCWVARARSTSSCETAFMVVRASPSRRRSLLARVSPSWRTSGVMRRAPTRIWPRRRNTDTFSPVPAICANYEACGARQSMEMLEPVRFTLAVLSLSGLRRFDHALICPPVPRLPRDTVR